MDFGFSPNLGIPWAATLAQIAATLAQIPATLPQIKIHDFWLSATGGNSENSWNLHGSEPQTAGDCEEHRVCMPA